MEDVVAKAQLLLQADVGVRHLHATEIADDNLLGQVDGGKILKTGIGKNETCDPDALEELSASLQAKANLTKNEIRIETSSWGVAALRADPELVFF